MYRSTSLFVLLLAKETAVTKYTTTASNAQAQALITMHTTRRAMEEGAGMTPAGPAGPATADLRWIPTWSTASISYSVPSPPHAAAAAEFARRRPPISYAAGSRAAAA